ncbi:hypothetical protein B0H11DRAFT_1286207 [Mycena galericulata]|nr:hypothetical protein B0H11DRAFT_1286207 [Mycena galericulata]
MVHLLARAVCGPVRCFPPALIIPQDAEVEDAIDYFISVFHQELWDFNPIPWIDRSNGRVCLDVMSNSSLDDNPPSSQYRCTMAPGIDAVMMLNEYHRLFPPLRPEQYHSILYQNFGYDFSHHEYGHVPPIHLASILWNSEGLEAVRVGDAANPVVIPTNTVITYERWETDSSETMANGWERYESNNVADTTISLEINCERPESWLSQANRIFERLNVTSNKENYALVKSVTFELFVKPDFIPRGYLFVCPPEDFRLPGTSSFRWPHCPAYWSFDRTGAERLSMEAANCHGFPPFELRTRMKLLSWDDSDYTGLREFHESWGFNPDSEDVARHLGDLIYKVSEEESTSDDEDSFDSPIQDLYEDTAQGLPSVHLATHCGPEEFVPLSRHSKVLMVVKLALILFIAVSSAYGGVPAQFD